MFISRKWFGFPCILCQNTFIKQKRITASPVSGRCPHLLSLSQAKWSQAEFSGTWCTAPALGTRLSGRRAASVYAQGREWPQGTPVCSLPHGAVLFSPPTATESMTLSRKWPQANSAQDDLGSQLGREEAPAAGERRCAGHTHLHGFRPEAQRKRVTWGNCWTPINQKDYYFTELF